MENTEGKYRIRTVNVVYLVTILLSILMAFLPLGFLLEVPWLQLIFSQVLFVIPSVVYMAACHVPYKEAVRFRKLKLADIGLSILFGILIQPVMTLINAVSMVFAKNTTSNFLVSMSTEIPFLAAVFLIAVVPAVLEETVYRGVFYNEYRKIDPWKGALLSGLLFGVMHGNINQFCYATVMGILFALLIEATGSILSTMLVHFWTNAGSVVMIYLYPKLYEVTQNFYNMYKEYGNTEMMEQLEFAMGDMTLSSEEWMAQIFDSASSLPLSIGDAFAMYGPVAIGAGVLAFFVYRKLAKRSGSWERICGSLPGRAVAKQTPEWLSGIEKPRLLTIPLLVAIVIGVLFMIYYEIMLHIG